MEEESLRKLVGNIKAFEEVKKEHALELTLKTLKEIIHTFNETVTISGCSFRKKMPKHLDTDFFRILQAIFDRKGWNVEIKRHTSKSDRSFDFKFYPKVKYKQILDFE